MVTAPRVFSEFVARFCGPAADVARVLGISAVQLQLLDQGRAGIPPSRLEDTVRRIGHGCKVADVQQALDECFTNRRIPGVFTQRLNRCSEDLARRGRQALQDVLREHFPDPLERDQVMGPDDRMRFQWKPAVVLVEPPQGEDRLDFPGWRPRRKPGRDAADTK